MSPRALESMELKPFSNYLYEYKKGVRNMVLYTMNRKHESAVTTRLRNQKIDYHVQYIGETKINLFFGKLECIEAITKMVNKPLNELSAEEDFILGALLGYDLRVQCERYCKRKS